ncbi:MAG: hypothetical protein NVS9B15_16770 [Acidobacteriaceae bacterium]
MRFSRALLCAVMGTQMLLAQTAGTYGISGVVVDEHSHQPIAGTKLVMVASQTSLEKRQVVNLGEDGRFSFANLPPGKYALYAEAPGYPQRGLNGRENFLTAVVVGPGKKSDGVEFALEREARIAGTVTDEAGEPVRDAQVALLKRSEVAGEIKVRIANMKTTDDRGQYHFRGLLPGEYFVAVAAHAWFADAVRQFPGPSASEMDVVYPVTFFGGTTDESAAKPVVLAPGQRIEADVTVIPTKALHLTLRQRDDHQSVLNLQRRIFDTWTVHSATQMTAQQNGNWVYSGIAPGRYMMRLERMQRQDAANGGTTVSVGVAAHRVPVVIESDMEIDPEQYASASAKVSGIVSLDGDSHAVASGRGDRLLLFQNTADDTRSVAQIDKDGRFETTLLPGKYLVVVENAGAYVIEDLVASGAAKVDGRDIVVTNGTGTIALSATNRLG